MKLIVKKFNAAVHEMNLEDGMEYILGRDSACDIVLQSSSLISRKHLKVSQGENQLWRMETLSDLGGLFLEGERVEGVEMDSPATLSFHEYTFDFRDPEAEKAAADAAAAAQAQKEAEEKERLQQEAARAAAPVRSDGATRMTASAFMKYGLNIFDRKTFVHYADLSDGVSWVAGREEECDIVLENKYLTKRHFEIVRRNEGFFLKDLGSSNGTFLNDKKIPSQKERLLKSQDVISIGTVRLIFEEKHKDFHKLTENLPAVAGDAAAGAAPQPAEAAGGAGAGGVPALAHPKVLLTESGDEEESLDEEATAFRAAPSQTKKKLIIYGACGAALLALLLSKNSEKKKEAESAAVQEEEDAKTDRIESIYETAGRLFTQKKFSECIDELDHLHKLTERHKDSRQLFAQCENGRNRQQRLDEEKALLEQARKTKEKAATLIIGCKKKFKTFTSTDELDECLGEALTLDPGNDEISQMRISIEYAAELQVLEEERRKEREADIQKKRALWTKAKKLKDQGKDLKKLVAPAYRRFLAAAKDDPALKDLRDKARGELASMERKYDETLKGLYENCESLVKSSQMKEAYRVCLDILKFKKEDQQALAWAEEAKNFLRKKFKPLYAESKLQESLGKTEDAKKIWKQILAEDIEQGFYYQKAKAVLENYK